MMRRVMRAMAFVALCHTAQAQSPPPDTSRGFFAGEWTGSGAHGSYCYLKLNADGHGWVLIDGGAGDWMGAAIQWRNRQQSLQVDTVVPMRASPQRRVMPLELFVLRSEFNASLSLTWGGAAGACHLQRLDASARHLDRAQRVIEDLPPRGGTR